MGFWSSLINTGVQVAHWVANNAGNIKAAADKVAAIAKVVPLTAEELAAEGDNILPTLKNQIDKAQAELLAGAKEKFPQPTIPDGMSFKSIDLPALWPSPTVGRYAKVPPNIAKDINAMLTYSKIPTTIGKDVPIDVGEAIANQLFVPPDYNIRGLAEGNLTYNPVKIIMDNVTVFSGGQVFYEVPLGNPGTNAAWHSHIRLYYIYSDNHLKEFEAEKASLAIKTYPSKFNLGDSFSTTTLSIDWTGARAVNKLMSDAVNRMLADHLGEIEFMPPAVNTGTKFKYQFKTETSMGPAEVEGALATAIRKILPPPGKETPPRMPNIKVTNMATFVS